jgi:hypothetical protein
MVCSTSCAALRKKEKPPAPPLARQPAFVGTISLVNPESQFVLIDNGLLPTPPEGMVMKSYTNGAESAELIISNARRRPFAIANIRQGAPQKGDRVYVSAADAPSAQAAQPVSQPSAQPAAPAVPGAPPEIPDFFPPL